jgi:hypothetical protein
MRIQLIPFGWLEEVCIRIQVCNLPAYRNTESNKDKPLLATLHQHIREDSYHMFFNQKQM